MKKMINAGRAMASAVATALAASAGALNLLPSASKGATPNKYNVFKGNSAEILRHNARTDEAKAENFVGSKGKRKKQAARQRKQQNQIANGAAA